MYSYEGFVMAQAFQKVDYGVFRKTISLLAGAKIKNKTRTTYLYDDNNNMLAFLRVACIEPSGHSKPTEYYVRAQLDN